MLKEDNNSLTGSIHRWISIPENQLAIGHCRHAGALFLGRCPFQSLLSGTAELVVRVGCFSLACIYVIGACTPLSLNVAWSSRNPVARHRVKRRPGSKPRERERERERETKNEPGRESCNTTGQTADVNTWCAQEPLNSGTFGTVDCCRSDCPISFNLTRAVRLCG